MYEFSYKDIYSDLSMIEYVGLIRTREILFRRGSCQRALNCGYVLIVMVSFQKKIMLSMKFEFS